MSGTASHLDSFTILGVSIQVVVMGGFSNFTRLASRYLLEEKLGRNDKTGLAQFSPGEWYPLVSYLRVLERIDRDYGDSTVKQMGSCVPKYIPLPPTLTDIEQAFGAIDVAYHLNHGCGGKPMYSPETGVMTEGIGHYTCQRHPPQKQLSCRVDSVYPCAFDEGLLLTMAQRFEPTAALRHEPGTCRKTGGPQCVYTLTWR